MSYNSWLRDTGLESKAMLSKNTARLLVQLSVLQSVLEQETGMADSRVTRVDLAMIHLMTEIHLLVIMTQERGTD